MSLDAAIILFILFAVPAVLSLGDLLGRLKARRRINRLIKLHACRCAPKRGDPDVQLLYLSFRRRGEPPITKP